MRKRTVRNGMRLVMTAMILIVLASFYHAELASLFSLPFADERRIYTMGIFWAAALGGYGVVLTAFGCALPADKKDELIRILPTFLIIAGLVTLYFYLIVSSFDEPAHREFQRLRPGETITI